MFLHFFYFFTSNYQNFCRLIKYISVTHNDYFLFSVTTNLLSPLVAETFEQLKDKAHKCKKCKETFTFEMNYLLHREVCDPEKIFICPQCKREYASAQSFYNHRRYECGKPFDHKCLYCPYMTRLKGNLKGHVLRKHPEKNVGLNLQL